MAVESYQETLCHRERARFVLIAASKRFTTGGALRSAPNVDTSDGRGIRQLQTLAKARGTNVRIARVKRSMLIHRLQTGQAIRRCSVYDFSAIEPLL